MDGEYQVRLNFLEEAEQYYDRMESVLVGLADRGAEPQHLDEVLRLAHSIKGGAGMMGFMPLSQVAHRLEDYLKILRARHRSQPLDQELEACLLQAVDRLRQVGELHRQEAEIEEQEFAAQIQTLFAPLQSRLGELQAEDENTLLAEEEDVDVSLLLFENGVEDALDRLEAELAKFPAALSPAQLVQVLQSTAGELINFGRMRDLAVFIQLCQSISQQATGVAPTQVETFARQALKLWRQSQALVSLGRPEQIPATLALDPASLDIASGAATATAPVTAPVFEPLASVDLALDELALDGLQLDGLALGDLDQAIADFERELEQPNGLEQPNIEALATELDNLDPSDFQLADLELNALDLENLDLAAEVAAEIAAVSLPEVEIPELALPDLVLDTGDLTDLQSAFAELATEGIDTEMVGELVGTEVLTDEVITEDGVEAIGDKAIGDETTTPPTQNPASSVTEATGKTVRVPLEQLQRFNTLFSGLVLERNAINLRLDQMKGFVALLRERMYRLEQSNTQLRKWYDRASLEGIVATPGFPGAAPGESTSLRPVNLGLPGSSVNSGSSSAQFDSLEMDRYTDLHLLSQEQMETIVQMQEVMADVEFGLREMGQAVQGLNQTTRSVQESATRMQMRPFSDIVGRFPRAVRDWSMKFGKSARLKLEGEATLLDREVIESLSDPLLHLLRNAFDHGLETAESRRAAGKPEQGTITLRAAHQGNQTLITISDDGQGINLDKVRQRARKLGFPESLLSKASEKDLLELIFEPGFSTADQVSELSGRGVGMDVVRTNLLQLRGEVQVATQAGLGTTFTISLPFNLSILPVLLLENADLVFSIAADSVREVLRPTREQLLTLAEQEYLNWNDQTVPLVRLEQSLGFRRPSKPFQLEGRPAINQPTILLVGQGNNLRGVYVDRVWGEQEVAVRPIVSPLALPPGFFSTSLLGDGRVVPLVDLVQLTGWISEGGAGAQKQTEANQLLQTTIQQLNQNVPILVVDDSVNVRRYLAMVLERAGYQVEQARDGQDAVDKLVGGLKVQAVICDVEMPRLDGYGVLAELRSKPSFRELPIAMLTSRSSDKHRKLAMNLGASKYLSKPCTDQELLNSLEEMLGERQVLVS